MEQAAGVIGQVQTTALGYADMDGHTILYAATTGGQATTTTTDASAKTPRRALATSSTLVSAGIYRYVQLPAPKLTSFTPASGPVGTTVTLTGTGLTGASKVTFNGVAAKFTVDSATKTTATVPAAASTGKIALTTPGGVATSATNFTVLVTPKLTLKLSGLTHGVLKLGKRLTAKGTVKPKSLAGSKVTLTVQRKQGGKWRKVRSTVRRIAAGGAYGWKYKPVKKGSYRLRATIAKTATRTAARTTWRTFKVK